MISEKTKSHYDLKKRNEVQESAKRLRRQFLRYKGAYSKGTQIVLIEMKNDSHPVPKQKEGTVNPDILMPNRRLHSFVK